MCSIDYSQPIDKIMLIKQPSTLIEITKDMISDIESCSTLSKHMKSHGISDMICYPVLITDIVVAKILWFCKDNKKVLYYDILSNIISSLARFDISLLPSSEVNTFNADLDSTENYYNKMSIEELEKSRDLIYMYRKDVKSFYDDSPIDMPNFIQIMLNNWEIILSKIAIVTTESEFQRFENYFKSSLYAIKFAVETYSEDNIICNAILGINVKEHMVSEQRQLEVISEASTDPTSDDADSLMTQVNDIYRHKRCESFDFI